MADGDYAVSRVDDLPQLWGGVAKLVRAGLGIRAFGVQILDLPPDYTTRSHDESASGQEELYVALRGSGAVVLDDVPDGRLPLDPDHVARVGPGVPRSLRSGPDGPARALRRRDPRPGLRGAGLDRA